MRGTTFLAALAIGSVAHACPTSLITIPIADFLAHREVSISHTIAGQDHDRQYWHSMVATAGVYDRFELGVGTDYDRVSTWSAKVNLWESPSWSKNTACSVGVFNVYGDKVDLYAMGRIDLDNCRIHAGYQRLDYVSSLVIGMDFSVCENCSVQAEHISGKEGYSWFAVSGQVVDGLAIQLAVGRPNFASNRVQHFICFTGGFRF